MGALSFVEFYHLTEHYSKLGCLITIPPTAVSGGAEKVIYHFEHIAHINFYLMKKLFRRISAISFRHIIQSTRDGAEFWIKKVAK